MVETCGKSGPQCILWDDGTLQLYTWQHRERCGKLVNMGEAALGETEKGTWICKECLIKAGYIW